MAIKNVNSKITRIVAEDLKAPEDTKNGSILGTYTGKCCDASVTNNNDMTLGRELFETLFASEDYKRALALGHYIGFLGHPEDPGCQDYEHACIVMRDCKIADNDEIIGTFDVLNTPVGQIVKTMEDAGINLGISIRGAGDVDVDGTVDPETFVFRGFDLVTFPAYDDAIPTFQELAASSDIEKQVAYKKICSTINKNIDHISITAAEELQKNFNKDSDEYQKLEARKADIGVEDEGCPDGECSEEDKLEVIGKKLECMTEMYMDACTENDHLKEEVESCEKQMNDVQASCDRKLKHLERITRSQHQLLQDRVDAATKSYKTAIRANRKLKLQLSESEHKLQNVTAANSTIVAELNELKNSNLIYQQKIESSTADIEEKAKAISALQGKLDKTVMASTEATRKASNRDEEVRRLQSKVSASTEVIDDLESRVTTAEDMLHQYQQAYADLYATAIGTSVTGLPVTASTSVRDLENLIQGATNTSNISCAPSYGANDYDDEVMEELDSPADVEEIDGYNADLVTL